MAYTVLETLDHPGSINFQDGWDKNILGMRGSINFHDGQGFIWPKNLGMRGSFNYQDGWD